MFRQVPSGTVQQHFINNPVSRNNRFNSYKECIKFNNCAPFLRGTTDKTLLDIYGRALRTRPSARGSRIPVMTVCSAAVHHADQVDSTGTNKFARLRDLSAGRWALREHNE